MDLRQVKLTAEEWDALEVPVPGEDVDFVGDTDCGQDDRQNRDGQVDRNTDPTHQAEHGDQARADFA